MGLKSTSPEAGTLLANLDAGWKEYGLLPPVSGPEMSFAKKRACLTGRSFLPDLTGASRFRILYRLGKARVLRGSRPSAPAKEIRLRLDGSVWSPPEPLFPAPALTSTGMTA